VHTVGRITQLARYPVKSMAGESLPAISLTLQGLPEDRRYAFVRDRHEVFSHGDGEVGKMSAHD